jgi:glycine cleavage system H lipoate-binding protein
MDPYVDGWLVVVEMADPKHLDGLLDAEAYQDLRAAEEAD